MKTLTEIAEKLKKVKSAAIFCHVRPDGDAIGSATALKLCLERLGIRTDAYCDDAVPEKYLFIPETACISCGDCGEYDAYIAVDSADETRLGKYGSIFSSRKNTFNIDHHISNTRYSENDFVSAEAANCENIYDLIKLTNVEIDKTTANVLAMGILADTGNFRHKNVTYKSLLKAADLVARGADLNALNYNLFTLQSKERAKLFGMTMSRIRYYFGGKFALVRVTGKDLEESGARQDETEGFIDFVMGIRGVEVGACLLETEKDRFKISFRSNGKADVNSVAAVFGGGGHTLASGCMINGEFEEVADKVSFAVKSRLSE